MNKDILVNNLIAIIKLIRYSDSNSWKVSKSGGQDAYFGEPHIMRIIDTELSKIGISLTKD